MSDMLEGDMPRKLLLALLNGTPGGVPEETCIRFLAWAENALIDAALVKLICDGKIAVYPPTGDDPNDWLFEAPCRCPECDNTVTPEGEHGISRSETTLNTIAAMLLATEKPPSDLARLETRAHGIRASDLTAGHGNRHHPEQTGGARSKTSQEEQSTQSKQSPSPSAPHAAGL